jgi:hypothetical protein
MSPVEPGGGAPAPDDPEVLLEALVELGARITRLLSTDARRYFEHNVRRCFVEAPLFAEALSDESLKALKASTAEAAERVAELLSGHLDASSWRDTTPPDAEGAPITEHRAVDMAMRRVTGGVEQFLAEHGIPGEPTPWTPPVRFIDGETLPTLTRRLWRLAGRYREAADAARAAGPAQGAGARAQRWDDA